MELPMTNYRRGYVVERKVIERAIKQGIPKEYCARTAGSHSAMDIIVVDTKYNLITIYQCKRTKGKSFPKVKLPEDRPYNVRFRTLYYQDRKGFVLECDGDGNPIDNT
jgi:hypothetical protein